MVDECIVLIPGDSTVESVTSEPGLWKDESEEERAQRAKNAVFIAAANPATILALVREVRLLRELEEWTRGELGFEDSCGFELAVQLDALRSERQS